ncbi:MarR family transcriptional regulator [Microbulbifer sp.]|uniref:MarR family winged helix-turn-helix transcriptional regulator n=1 Tax=Microbulbifer sp. TaxID=1908541 RepID=UPI002584BABA|nr:MarR family transcriptional regulator [Microbulbifer sp.]
MQADNLERVVKPQVEPCLALHLRKANRVLTQLYDHDMAVHGIKITQFAILRAIHFLGETTNRGLQDVLVLDQTTLSRNLKPLLRDGYLETLPGADRREKRLQLSSSGRRLYQQACKSWARTQGALKSLLGNELTDQLLAVGEAVVALKESAE